MRNFLTAALALLLAAAPLSAQKKAETRLYQKTLSQPSLEAFDKFLKKYPSSVYATDILARKDTLLNISPYDEEQAARIARDLLPGGCEFRAVADRREAVDRIYALCLDGEGVVRPFRRAHLAPFFLLNQLRQLTEHVFPGAAQIDRR